MRRAREYWLKRAAEEQARSEAAPFTREARLELAEIFRRRAEASCEADEARFDPSSRSDAA